MQNQLQLKDNESIVLERTYIVPLRGAWNSAYHKRTKRAIRILREFASRHMKVDKEEVYIHPVLNRKIWARGNANPPRKIRVVMRKTSEGRVLIYDYDDYMRISKEEKKSEEKIEEKEEKGKEKSEEEKKDKEEKESTEKK